MTTTEIPRIAFMTDWNPRAPAEARAAYADAEVRRLVESGERLLLAVLALPDPDAADAAIRAATRYAPTVYLKLAPGASPPHLDPQGRPLRPDARGKVLVAKTGTRGAHFDDGEATRAAWSGSARRRTAIRGEEIYQTATVRADRPTPLPFGEALEVMRRWGRYVHPTGRKPVDKLRATTDAALRMAIETHRAHGLAIDGDVVVRDVWLVEQTDAAGDPLPPVVR